MKFILIIFIFFYLTTTIISQNHQYETGLITSNQKKTDLNPIPYLTIKYLDENYKDYVILESVREDNGDNKILIKYKPKTRKSYLKKNLSFDSYGQLIP